MVTIASHIALYLLLLSGPLLALAVRGFAPMLVFAGLAGLTAFIAARPKFDRAGLKRVALPLATLAYILLSAAWGISERAGDTALRLTATIGFAALVLWIFANRPAAEQHIWANRLLISVGGGMAIALLIGPYNVYRPDLPELLEDHFELLRQVNSSLSILPVFLFLTASALSPRRPRLVVGLLIAALLVTALSESQTSLLSMLLGLVGFALAKVSLKLCRHVIFAAFALCTLTAVPVSIAAYEHKWVENYAPTIVTEQGAGNIRQWIYQIYAKEALNRPFFGHGLNGTKYFAPADFDAYTQGTQYHKGITDHIEAAGDSGVVAAHAHNLFLQLIFEFGYLGALLILAAIWQGFARLELQYQGPQAAWLCGAIGACLGTLMFGFTLWHSWLMAALAVMVIFARIMLARMSDAESQ